MKLLFFSCTAAWALASVTAAPVIRDIAIAQDARTHLVKITYTLENESALVAINLQTNGVTVSDILGCFNDPYGDASPAVNRVVKTGDHTILWNPEREWPGQFLDANRFAVSLTAYATNTQPDVLVVNLTKQNAYTFYRSAADVPLGITNRLYKTDYLALRRIPSHGVTWRMGSPTDEAGRNANRETPHYVTFETQDYYIGVYPVTQRQYELVTGTNPSTYVGDEESPVRPVDTISYNLVRGLSFPDSGSSVGAATFIGKLRTLSGISFDLPTDAQWEYACRAGTGDAYYGPLGDIAWYKDNNTANTTHEVGLKLPNSFGIYDMVGHVWECCRGTLNTTVTVSGDPVTDPESDAGGTGLVRGGSFRNTAAESRAAYRNDLNRSGAHSNEGFRMWCAAFAE